MRKITVTPSSLLIAAFALFFLCTQLQAQYENGGMVGTIRDASGAPISGADVKITNNATGIATDAKTDGSGDYEIPSLPGGRLHHLGQRQGLLRRRRQ